MKPSTALNNKRDLVRDTASRFRTANVRVFGSARHGTDRADSDLDLLVDPMPGATLFDLGGLQVDLEDRLGVPVDLRTPGDLPASFRERVLADAMLL
jgi:predicted nucleotidyltransferase